MGSSVRAGETSGLRSSFAENGIDDAENLGAPVGVKLEHLANKGGGGRASARVRMDRIGGQPTRPCRQSLEVQSIELGQLQENDRIGLFDPTPFDL